MSKSSLTNKAFILSSARCLAFVLTAFHPVVLTRILSKSDYGTYAQFYLVVMTLIPLGEMGIVQGIYFFLPKGGVIKSRIAFHACLLILLTGLLVCCGLVAFNRYLALMIGNPHITALVPFMAFYCFCSIASSAFEALMIAEGNCALASTVTLAMQLVNSSALIGGALTSRSLTGIMMAICVGAAVRLLLQYLYVGRQYGFPPRPADLTGLGKTLRYVLPTGAAGFIWSLQGKIQGYLVSSLFSPAVFAAYAVGTVSLPFVGIITTTASNVMMPEIARTGRDAGGRSHILGVWNGAIRKMNLFLMPMFVFFFFMAEPFIVLMYTEQYRDSVTLFRLSLMNVLIASINNAAVIGGLGESRYLMMLSMLRLPLSLLLVVSLTHVYGVAGAVVSNAIVTVLIILIEFKKVASLLNVRVIELVRWGENGQVLAAAVLACLPLLIVVAAGWSLVATLTIGIAVYGAAYLSSTWILALRPDEIDLLKRIGISAMRKLRAVVSAGVR